MLAEKVWRLAAIAMCSLLVAACQQRSAPADSLQQPLPVQYPPYNKVYGIATHNSYWLNRSDQADLYASGTQELVSDQLLHEHVRAVEFDVHSEGAPDHQWKVYHTSDSEDFKCRYLTDCLEYLRNFHYASPQHEVINVIIELKNVVAPSGIMAYKDVTQGNFNETHTMDDFDNILRQTLGPTLYTPMEYFNDVGPGSPFCNPSRTVASIAKCVAEHGWPTIDMLRGKFIVNLMGNYGTAMEDWTYYASDPQFFSKGRVAWPIASVFGIQDSSTCAATQPPGSNADPTHPVLLDGTTYCIREMDDRFYSPWVDFSYRQKAYDMSAFWQFEPVDSDFAVGVAKDFLARGGIIRGHDSFEYSSYCFMFDPNGTNCQEARVKAGYQLIQTDYPWFFTNNLGPSIPTDPAQRLKDPAWINGAIGNEYDEPGTKLYFQTDDTYPGVWAYADVPSDGDRWWEATVSSTRIGDTWGIHMTGLFGIDLTVDDIQHNCPGYPDAESDDGCTSYPRSAKEDGEGCIAVGSASGKYRVELCRQKTNPGGLSFYQESVNLVLRVYKDGVRIRSNDFTAPRYAPCKASNDPNSGDVYSNTCIGSMIALAIKNDGASSIVSLYSAGKLKATEWSPDWALLSYGTFDEPMTKQGYRGWKSELFAGTRMADQLDPVGTNDWRPDPAHLHAVALPDLPNREGVVPGTSYVEDRSFRAVLSTSRTSATTNPTADQYGWIGRPALQAANLDHVAVSLQSPSPLIISGALFKELDYSMSGAQMTGTTVSTANPTTLSVSSEGSTAITYHAVDLDGNVQPDQNTTVNLDVTPPTIAPSITPAPNGAGWNRTAVSVSFQCDDALSQVLNCTPAASLTGEGRGQTVNGTAQDQALNSASVSVNVNIDLTPPVVGYTGNQGTYTIDQSVDIACFATDSLSGIATNSCVPLVGPAYQFAVGNNTYSFTATDVAGNSSTAQTAFDVEVTFDSLCNLTRRFCTDQRTANVLCSTLHRAKSAPNVPARDGLLSAFEYQLSAKVGTDISAADANILLRLVAYLF